MAVRGAAVLTALLVLAVLAALWQRAEARSARIERDQAREAAEDLALALDAAQEAARVHRAHLARIEADLARWLALEEDVVIEEGGDAPASDYLRGVVDRVRK